MTQSEPYIYRSKAERYEDDLRAGIVSMPAETGVRYSQSYVTCRLGPRCPYPVSCCPECYRHKIGGHTCGNR